MTVRRTFDLILLLGLLVGGTWAWRLGAARAGIEAELVRLAAKTGALSVGDPNRVQVAAVPVEGPLRFAWRIYVPSEKRIDGKWGSMTAMTGMSRPGEYAIRVALDVQPAGLMLRITGSGPRNPTGWGQWLVDAALADLVRGRSEQLVVEQLGRGGPVVADPAGPLTLLRLSLPPDMVAEANARLGPGAARVGAELLTLTIH